MGENKNQQKEFLYIEDDEISNLPKRFRKVNNICAILYDQLTEIYVEENYEHLNHTEIVRPEFEKLSNELKNDGVHVLDWLRENGAINELTEVLTKHLVMSITSDFLNFMYESLRSAKNGKMTVAYALLRKPLTDELLILEQLLVDKHDFIQRFYMEGKITGYDPSPRNKNIDKKSIIEEAVKRLYLFPIFVPDYIYEVRYDKSCDYGLSGITNQALHIVTNDLHYKTEEQNLNFVFSTEEDVKRYREHYYSFVPYLLNYAISVIDGIIFDILKDEDNQNLRYVKVLRRLTGFMLINKHTKTIDKKNIDNIFKIIGDGMPKECHICGHLNTVEQADFELFFYTEAFVCQNCFNNYLSTPESVQSIKNFFNGFKDLDDAD